MFEIVTNSSGNPVSFDTLEEALKFIENQED